MYQLTHLRDVSFPDCDNKVNNKETKDPLVDEFTP